MCGKWSVNLQADVRGDPTIFFENTMCEMFFPKFVLHFLQTSSKSQRYF